MPGIFLSYRRDDSAGYAGRLGDDLRERFGAQSVFMDIDAIEYGVDFVEAIESAVQSCDVLLAMIGRQWLTAPGPKGQRRLDDPRDYVRLEISAALKRKIRVIPVLVQNASMPSEEDLPEDLISLARRNALEVADARWKYDVKSLTDTLDRIIGYPKPSVVTTPTQNPQVSIGPPVAKVAVDGEPRSRFRRGLAYVPLLAFLLLIAFSFVLGASPARADREIAPLFFGAGLVGVLAQLTWWRITRKRRKAKQPQ